MLCFFAYLSDVREASLTLKAKGLKTCPQVNLV